MTTNKTVKTQAEELAKKFIKAESVDMYDDSKLTDLIEGFLTKLTESNRLRDKYHDGMGISNASCKRRGERIDELKAKLTEAEKVIDAADEYVRIGDRYGVSCKMKLKEALFNYKEARE